MSSLFCDYFEWLYNYAGLNDVRGYSYKSLADLLHTKKFVSIVPHDENRIADGVALREEFIESECMCFDDEVDDLMNYEDCSVLEMLIALAKRMDFEVYNPDKPVRRVPEFVYLLISNLGLDIYDDDSETDYYDIDEILETLIGRTYEYDGDGGLFPLNDPEDDQRDIEIWQQMMQYMREEGYI